MMEFSGRWWLLLLYFLYFLHTMLVFGDKSIGDRTYQHSPPGSNEYLTCNKCPPGTHLTAHCTKDNLNAQCSPCKKGSTFTTNYNTALACAPCKSYCVDARKKPVNSCVVTSDLVCQCPLGYFNIPKEDVCKNHKKCEPGEGVAKNGDHEHDTQCEACVEGQTFSPDLSLTQICEPCQTCPKGHKVKVECRVDNNTECEEDTGDEGLGVGVILGIVFGILLALIIILGVLLRLWRTNRLPCCRNTDRGKTHNGTSPARSDGGPLIGNDNVDTGMRNPSSHVMVELDYPGVVSDKILEKLSADLIFPDRNFFFRILFVENADKEIHRAEQDYKNSGVEEQIYRILLRWKYMAKENAKLEKIIEVLEERGRNDLAVKYSEFLEKKTKSEESPSSQKKVNGSPPKMSDSGNNDRHNGTKSASPPQKGDDSPHSLRTQSSVSADSTSPLTDSVNCTRNGGDSSIGGGIRSQSVGSAASYSSQRNRVSNHSQMRTSAQSLSSRQSDV